MTLLKNLILVLLTILIRFPITEQFFKRFKVPIIMSTKIKFNIRLSAFNETLAVEELEQEGLTNWQQIFSTAYNWKSKNGQKLYEMILKNQEQTSQQQTRLPYFSKFCDCFRKPSTDLQILNLLVKSPSKDSFYKSFTRDFPELLKETTIPDVIAFSVKGVSMNLEDLQATIDFFLKNNFYRQLACLITYQANPPIVPEHFETVPLEKMTKVFEYLIMMNPDKVNGLFALILQAKINKKLLAGMVSALIASNKRLPDKFDEIIRKVLDSNCITKYELIKSICLGFVATNYNVKNREHLFCQNEKLIDSFYSKIDNFERKEIGEISMALKACHVINLIKLDPFDYESVLYAICMKAKNERDSDAYDHDEADSESIRLLFKFLKKITFIFDDYYYEEFIESYEDKLSLIM